MAIPLTLFKVAKAALPFKCSSDNQILVLLGAKEREIVP